MKRKEPSFLAVNVSFFFLFAILFIPFSFSLIRFQFSVTHFLFGWLIDLISTWVFDHPLKDTGVYSDSFSMYILIGILVLLSIVTSVLFFSIKVFRNKRDQFVLIIYHICLIYLSLILFKYGLDKVFKTQFYLPEPNILFTPVGQLSRDILFWSTMGTSHAYNIFLGSIEILAALLLFFQRTRMLGLLIAVAALAHIIAINFSFDISVKLFSVLLFLMTFYLLHPYLKKLYCFFFSKENIHLEVLNNSKQKNLHLSLSKLITPAIIVFIIIESFYPYIIYRNFNDDNAKRPYLHGAYEVNAVVYENDTLPVSSSPVKRIFIHRDHYLIFQDHADVMHDYKLNSDVSKTSLIITDYDNNQRRLPYSMNDKDSFFKIQYPIKGKNYWLLCKKTDWKKLPLLQSGFNWTYD